MIINNAGIGGGGQPVWAMSDNDYERTLQINFFGVVYGTRAFLPQLLANGEGAIVNVSSVVWPSRHAQLVWITAWPPILPCAVLKNH